MQMIRYGFYMFFHVELDFEIYLCIIDLDV